METRSARRGACLLHSARLSPCSFDFTYPPTRSYTQPPSCRSPFGACDSATQLGHFAFWNALAANALKSTTNRNRIRLCLPRLDAGTRPSRVSASETAGRLLSDRGVLCHWDRKGLRCPQPVTSGIRAQPTKAADCWATVKNKAVTAAQSFVTVEFSVLCAT